MIRLVALLVLALLSGACGGPSGPSTVRVTTDPIDELTLQSAQPASGAALARGATVTLRYTVNYTLVTGDTGYVAMAVQDQENRPLPTPVAGPSVSVTRGTGSREITYTLQVPEAGYVTGIRVFLPLFAGDERRTGKVVLVQYPVQ